MGMTVMEIRALLQTADEKSLAALKRSLAADTRKGVKSALEVADRRIAQEKAETKRLESLHAFERSFLKEGESLIVGLDEVGRGAVAGPLAVGAVVLPPEASIVGLDDSKQLSAEQRQKIAADIKQQALAWTVEYVQPAFIDHHGMTAALKTAFSNAVSRIEQTGIVPDVVLLDGNPLHFHPREKNVVKGDAKCASIAAASIVAKVERDALMCALDGEYPGYDFVHNKGYGSPQHIEAIRELGMSPVHRRSFCKSFMQETLF